jgi:hypothetical protein
MLRIFKILFYITIFSNFAIFNSYGAEKKANHTKNIIPNYIEIYQKSALKTKQIINKITKNGNRLYHLEANMLNKYLEYGKNHSITDRNGTHKINGNDINPQIAHGLGIGITTDITPSLDVFIRENYYFLANSQQIERTDDSEVIDHNIDYQTFTVKSDSNISFIELILGIKNKFKLNSKHHIYLGAALSAEYYKITYHYLTDNIKQHHKNTIIKTLGYNSLFGYNFTLDPFNRYNIYIEANYKFLPHQSMIKNSANLMLGFSYKFKIK